MGPETKINSAGEGQQQFTGLNWIGVDRKLELHDFQSREILKYGH
jgi:hypothetical protein